MCVASTVLLLVAITVMMVAFTWAGWNWPRQPVHYVSPRLLVGAGVWMVVAAIAVAINC